MATKLEVEDIPHANVDDTQEALVPTLELALVEYLDGNDRVFLHGAGRTLSGAGRENSKREAHMSKLSFQ